MLPGAFFNLSSLDLLLFLFGLWMMGRLINVDWTVGGWQ
jgi:hypothetical protein